MSTIYLAGPIAAVDDLEPEARWRNDARKHAREAWGASVLVPDAFQSAEPRSFRTWEEATLRVLGARGVAYDVSCVRDCDGVLVKMLPGVKSEGCSGEVTLAHSLGKPVVLWEPEGPIEPYRWPLWFALARSADLHEALDRLLGMLLLRSMWPSPRQGR